LKISKIKILTIIAALNSILIGLTAYLTVFMYRNNVTEFATLSGLIIPICLLVSLLTKLKYYNKLILCVSVLFDLILIVYIYNPTDSESISDYIKGVIDPNTLILTLIYGYLIIYYLIAFNQKIDKRKLTPN
jgi:hypothetical protein